MAGRTFQGRDGAIRLYDGATPTPYYIQIPFVQMDFQGPTARPRPQDPVVATVGGYVHAPSGADYDQQFFEPVGIAFSFWAERRTFESVRGALSNIGNNNPWQVGSHTWTTTKGRGSIQVADETWVDTQPFFDSRKVAVQAQVLWTDPRYPAAPGSTIGFSYDETWFAPQDMLIAESGDYVQVQAQGLVYGQIRPISTFTAGTASVAYEE